MTELINEFLNYLSVERGLSKNTVSSYRADLSRFINYLESKGIKDIDKIKREDVRGHLLHLKDNGLSSNSISRALAAIKVFYRFLVRERILSIDPTSLIDSPKLWKKIPEVLSLNLGNSGAFHRGAEFRCRVHKV